MASKEKGKRHRKRRKREGQVRTGREERQLL